MNTTGVTNSTVVSAFVRGVRFGEGGGWGGVGEITDIVYHYETSAYTYLPALKTPISYLFVDL
jgi:hypothetical protein